ncbi:MAG: phosphoenolpyruvate carboxylase [Candidatus Bathyarchaeota archaeon]|nr:phosphoenolpyruvate carboxylase [Candidatus Bathyarchaeota archaeon]MDW8040951.1 phosphoenolpyruvate carboxylase [Nitrososphaerota archaeon]
MNIGSLEGFGMDSVDRKIPRTMSTQHPDNVSLPSWVNGDIIQGDAEIDEAFFAYNVLGCMEVMWDSEGKDVDTHVVRKLLSKYGEFFKEKVIGENVYLTYRVPNPKVEITERKILLESLVNIPVAHDIASAFYKREVSPIFEVILPFTTTSDELFWLLRYYEKTIAGVENVELNGSVKVTDWIGPFKPKSIEVIPLIEDMESILKIDQIVEPYLRVVKPKYLRVFIARSDPALNYGLVCAVILCKIAFSKLKRLETATGLPLYPIVGVGTMPFRGHLSPDNIDYFMREYAGVCTATIQSALKYDYPLESVRKTVEVLNDKIPCGEPAVMEPAEIETLKGVLAKFTADYQEVVEHLAPLINRVADYVPQRRARKLHIGLFGYSRSVGRVTLPRAIPFAAALYSLGIPPEFVGFRAIHNLNEAEWSALSKYYVNLKHDLEFVGGFLSWRNLNMLGDMHKQVAKIAGANEEDLRLGLANIMKDLEAVEQSFSINLGPKNLTQRRYENMVNDFLIAFIEQKSQDAQKCLVEAARIRRCLG